MIYNIQAQRSIKQSILSNQVLAQSLNIKTAEDIFHITQFIFYIPHRDREHTKYQPTEKYKSGEKYKKPKLQRTSRGGCCIPFERKECRAPFSKWPALAHSGPASIRLMRTRKGM